MFDLSLVELLFIAVIALLVIGPKDLPKALAAIIGLFKQVQSAFAEVRKQVDDIVESSGMEETKQELKTIIDQHGEVQEVYDVADFLDDEGRFKVSGPDNESVDKP